MQALSQLVLAAVVAQSPSAGPGEVNHDPAGPLIYGGDLVEPGAWPAVVAVRTTKLCTGTLVAPDLILTAAHCFDPAPSLPVEITFGDDIVSPSSNTVESDEWGAHPDFCLPSECGEDIHDFAWVKLPGTVAIEPILPITDQAEFDELMTIGQPMHFVGFGEDEAKAVGYKREVEASLTSCNETGREFRAGGGGKDSCQGDSGGPALAQLASGEWRLTGSCRAAATVVRGIYGVPLPELCWLRDDSGVDLLPGGCAACDCVNLVKPVEDEGCGCALEDAGDEDGPRGAWLAGPLGLIIGAGSWWRRRSRRRLRREP